MVDDDAPLRTARRWSRGVRCQLFTYSVIAAIIGGAVTMFVGLLGVAWKLGGLERTVEDVERRLDEMDGNKRPWR